MNKMGMYMKTAGFKIDTKAFTAIIPCSTRQWRSPMFLANGGLYNMPQAGFVSPLTLKCSLQGVSFLVFSFPLFTALTHTLYRVFPLIQSSAIHSLLPTSRRGFSPSESVSLALTANRGKGSFWSGIFSPLHQSLSSLCSSSDTVILKLARSCSAMRIEWISWRSTRFALEFQSQFGSQCHCVSYIPSSQLYKGFHWHHTTSD